MQLWVFLGLPVMRLSCLIACAGPFGALAPSWTKDFQAALQHSFRLYLTELGWLHQPLLPDCPPPPRPCTPVLAEQDCHVLASSLAIALLAADWGEDANCFALWLSLQTPALLIIH